jgi:hypothetical protein
MSDLNTHYVSGEPNTTGREPFEDDNRIGDFGSGGNTQHLSGGIGGASGAGGIGSAGTGAGLGSGQTGTFGEGHKDVAPHAAHAHGVRPSLMVSS